MIKEQIFINGGELYKEERVFEGPVESNYTLDMNNDPIFTYYKNTDSGKKYYNTTLDFRNWLLGGFTDGINIDSFDLCPSVTLWCGRGYVKDENELYFKVDDSSMLNDVADYYSLPYPVDSATGNVIDNSPEVIASYFNEAEEPLVLGSVKFKDGLPVMLKLYTVYRYIGRWNLFNKGRVFSNGVVIEDGGMYYTRFDVKYVSTSGDNIVTEYVQDDTDPILKWKGIVKDLTTGEAYEKMYESSNVVRKAIGNLDTGDNFNSYDKAPIVNWWLARSTIKDKEELYFLVESREMLDEVASYYGLSVPYDSELKDTLDNNIESIRFKSYDLDRLGEGNFVAVVVASVEFADGIAINLKLYETTRWNE